VAVVVTTTQPDGDATVRGLGPALRLAAANERLLAAVRHRLLELQASRQRIVEAADAERHHLERDLHDGAQQSLVSLIHELSLARDMARLDDDGVTGDRLARAVDETDAAIEALRLVARGIHDPVLAESGLLAALDALSVDAPIPVGFDMPQELSCRPESASAAWRVVVDAVEQATRLGAEGVTGRVSVVDGTIIMALAVEGIDEPLTLLPMEDRVAAGGGRLTTRWDGPSILELQAELPCA
jgi:signal transduction histidine kinase